MGVRATVERLRSAALFATGLAVGLHYARMGYMPLDQSIVFDGGWRIASGQTPFVDYTAPNGFTVHALQALFFRLCGVTWFAYCLHAAVINGLATVLVDRLLLLLGLERWASSVFALCTALAFYPPFGVPFMDQHAFFFSLAALVFAIGGVRAEDAGARRWCWLAVMPSLALAYLSKQIPSVFFLPAVLALALFAPLERAKALRRMAASALAVVALLYLTAALAGVDWGALDTYARRLPTEEGARRLGYVPSVGAFLERFEQTRVQFGLWSIALVHLVGIAGTLAALASAAVIARRRDWKWTRPIATALAAEFLLVASLAFVALTSNDKENGVALVFVRAGAAAAALFALGTLLGERPRWVARGLVAVLACVALRDARKLQREVLDTRKVNDIAFDADAADSASAELPEALAFLRWQTPKLVGYSAGDLRDLVAYLSAREGNFLVLGDDSILYGLCRRASLSPSLWFHPGLTFPLPQDPEFARYEQRLVDELERGAATAVVIEPRVWIGYLDTSGPKPAGKLVTLDTFPKLAALVAARTTGEREFGPIRVLELGPR